MENTKVRGRLTKEELVSKIKSGEIQYITGCIPTTQIVNFKRFDAKYFLNSILENGYRIPELTLCININHDLIANEKNTFNQINDVKVKIDSNCIRKMPWLGKEHCLVMTDVYDLSLKRNQFSPRGILKNKLEEIEKDFGVRIFCASELEYYILNSPNDEIIKNNPAIDINKHKLSQRISEYDISTYMDRYEPFNKIIKDNINEAGIELEALFLEYGPGQHEVNIRYSDVLENCDNHVILKQSIKHTAYKNKLGCSFMAKTFKDNSGSSCHVHISALDLNKKNIFAPSEKKEENFKIDFNDTEVFINKKLYFFIGGILKYLEDLFILYCPTVNSYKRFKSYSFAPLFINTWCYESKTSALRILGTGEDVRLEVRIGGADVNPYLLLTGIIASGFKGIEDSIEPNAIQIGDVYAKNDPLLVKAPANLYEAIKSFEKSNLAMEIFGKHYHQFLVDSSMKEWNDYMDEVSTFEVNRYLELI